MPTPTEQQITLFRSIDPFGEAHIVIGDLNVDDANIQALLASDMATADEKSAGSVLLAMPEDDREQFLIDCGC